MIVTNLKTSAQLDENTTRNVKLWLDGDYDSETKKEILRLLRENPKEISDAFYTNLSFGTGGLRGIMGVGTNRMNAYTVRAATQGLANYLKAQPFASKEMWVFIGYDSRHNSRNFAEETAKVLAANGINVYLFSDIRPTPLVSFACRYKHCTAAIMITASHNPPDYNGYKVYWNDGGQILPPHDIGIIREANNITSLSQVKTAKSLENPRIKMIDTEIDDAYFECIRKYPYYPEENKKFGHTLKIVYTSFHGTGITLMPDALDLWGFSKPILVERQVIPDGVVAFPRGFAFGQHGALYLSSGIGPSGDGDNTVAVLIVRGYLETPALLTRLS